MKILFLANRPTANSQASTVSEYLDSLVKFSKHELFEISMLGRFPSNIDLDKFDVVLTHYSLSIGPLLTHYYGDDLIAKLKKFKGLKAAFLQDEYREVQTYWKHINELGIKLLFTCVPDDQIQTVYPFEKVPELTIVNVLTGYVPQTLTNRKVLPIAKRSIDVGYRTRKTPYWLGRLGYEKWMIAEEFQNRAEKSNLHLDLSTQEGDRLYGEAWTNFVASCRAVIGVESGASIIDFDGQLENCVDTYVSQNPNVSFEHVFEKFLKPYEGSLKLNQISPRCFEAAALRTPMILFEGNYSGVLKPDRHYIVLKKDFSNIEDILNKLKDHSYLQSLAETTFEEVALNPKWSYERFIEIVDTSIEDAMTRLKIETKKSNFCQNDFKKLVQKSYKYYWHRKLVLFIQSMLLGTPYARKAIFGLWEILPRPVQKIARPIAKIISK